ncbi:hypothetical protein [Anaerotignum sp. MB30-C6]|uniref:hypothetical protein n=1 Tax=Anaerotignum sp. MB30-C6 TaxID=3070814 RepID=UPI0027DD2391|nr:hypothetical protein [Anaerotignum sp. MB30-C6]WMI81600.1 hypothetical protein RBQ60_02355 [Anaerotignum sp. MB30-C6]
MKKLFTFLLCGVLAASILGGCGNEAEKPQKPQGEQENSNVIEESKEQKDNRGIKGSNYMQLTTALEVGLEFPSNEPKDMEEEGLKYIPMTEKEFDSGIKQAYLVCFDTDNQIVEVDFMIANMKQIDEGVFIDSAEIFFGLLANTSYEGSDAEAAEKWIEENIANAENGISTVIGDAKFTLEYSKTSAGTLGTIILIMEKETDN